MSKVWLFSLFIVVAVQGELCGQSTRVSFNHIGAEEGLTHLNNSYVSQDSRGFIWISSNSGLNRFDGQNLKVYRPDPQRREVSIQDNIITSPCFEDQNGDLWFTTYGAINRYIRSSDSFEHFTISDGDAPPFTSDYLGFYFDPVERVFWLRAGAVDQAGVFGVKVDTRTTTRYGVLTGNRLTMILNTEGRPKAVAAYWDGQATGIKYLPLDGTSSPRLLLDGMGVEVFKVAVARNNLWWVASNRGLIRYNPLTDTPVFQDTTIAGNAIIARGCLIYSADSIYVSTHGLGLLLYRPSQRKFTQQITHDPFDANSLRENTPNELYRDRQNNIWISIWGQGLDYFHPRKNKFGKFFQPSKVGQLRAVAYLPDGGLLVAAPKKMLVLDEHYQTVTEILQLTNDTLLEKYPPVFIMQNDQEGTIWCFTREHLFRYSVADNELEFVAKLPYQIRHAWLQQNKFVFFPRSGTIFEGTMEDGKLEMSPSEGLNDHDLKMVSNVFQDAKGRLMINADASRLLILDGQSMAKIADFKQVGYCHDFFEDTERQLIWIATSNGLVRLSALNGKDTLITESSLPVQEYYSTFPDEDGNLWLSSNNGVYRFAPESEDVHQFTIRDGLPSNQFSKWLFLQEGDGDIWLGTDSSLVRFDPEGVSNLDIVPKVQITELRVNDELPVDESTFIGEQQNLRLNYRYNTLSFRFAALEYSNPSTCKFKYRLIGADDIWIETDEGFARYPNLQPGNYTFEVIASNSDGVWMETPKRLSIYVKYPLVLQWWAILIYIGAGIAGFLWWRRGYQNRIRKEEQTKQLIELDKAKTQFYTGMTHEFRTPLTIIKTSVDRLFRFYQNRQTGDFIQGIKNVEQSGRNLLDLVDQLLDLAKHDAGELGLNMIQADVIDYLRRLHKDLYPLAINKQIQLIHDLEPQELVMDFDENKLGIIIRNLLSNAVKFTSEGGRVVLQSRQPDEHTLEIKVIDNGQGISKEDQEKIFQLFHQGSTNGRQKSSGTGIGLAYAQQLLELMKGKIQVESALGKGSTFMIRLPVSKEAAPDIPEYKTREHSFDVDSALEEESAPTHILEKEVANKPKLLLVEDERTLSGLMAEILGGDYEITTAYDGREGIQKALEEIPDIILTDVMMPEVDGVELCQTLRKDIKTSHIPILMLTAKAAEKDVLEGLRAGANDYITKPFNEKELQIRLGNMITLQKKLQQHYRNQFGDGLDEGPIMTQTEDPFLKTLYDFVIDNLDRSISVEELCSEVNMGYHAFLRKIKALTDETPGSFLRNIRLTEGKKLVKNTDDKLESVAYATGFNDLPHFSREFEKKYGIRPSVYRDQMRGR